MIDWKKHGAYADIEKAIRDQKRDVKRHKTVNNLVKRIKGTIKKKVENATKKGKREVIYNIDRIGEILSFILFEEKEWITYSIYKLKQKLNFGNDVSILYKSYNKIVISW